MELEERRYRFELFEAIVLSVAVVAASWTAYQSARWSGVQSIRLAEAAAAARTALEKHLFAQEQLTGDGVGAMHVMDALVEGKQNIIEFYVSRMRPELRSAVEAWLDAKPLENRNAPPHPLATTQYREQVLGVLRKQASDAQAEADRLLAKAREAKEFSEEYVMLNVLLASVLFLTGVAGKFHLGRTRQILLAMAVIVLIGVAAALAISPVAAN